MQEPKDNTADPTATTTGDTAPTEPAPLIRGRRQAPPSKAKIRKMVKLAHKTRVHMISDKPGSLRVIAGVTYRVGRAGNLIRVS